jgi:predicted alpha/beta-fold hydrolase
MPGFRRHGSQAPAWWREKNRGGDKKTEATEIRGELIQRSVALTMVDVIRGETGNPVRLLTQDPKYLDKTQRILEQDGFEVVRRAGAGGFAEIDEESVVFSAYMAALVKQIIADISRPELIFATTSDPIFGERGLSDCPFWTENGKVGLVDTHRGLYRDADSPRSRRMWQEYT